jgi:hypothetical protein
MMTIRLHWTTAALASVATVLAAGRSASAEIIKIVTPSSIRNVESPDVVNPAAVPARIQYLIPASDFASLPGLNRRIVAWNFRADASQTQPFNWTSNNSRIWMSTTDKTATTLTTTYDNNHGADKLLVHDGAISFPVLATGPASGPRNVADGPRLQHPFDYDPSNGNLLIEWMRFDGPTSPRIDVLSLNAPGATVLLNQTSPTAVAGSLFIQPPVLQFEFDAIPEPSTCVLASLLLVAFAGRRQRK